jgi:1-aminocyclopropane-1-carboxylate deaminase
MFENPKNTPLQLIDDEALSQFGVKLYIKREDLIHREISGNKWRKLKYNFLEAERLGLKKIVTVGGAFSNHIAAISAAAKLYDFESVGIIRGEPYHPLNPTLSFASNNGMKLLYWNREKFRAGFNHSTLTALKDDLGEFYFIPEGGTNELAVLGTKEIIDEIEMVFDSICCPVGTGGTIAGLVKGAPHFPYKVIGFSALKNNGFLEETIKKLIGTDHNDWEINNNYSFGGYAKHTSELINFINQFKRQHHIELDPIYTGKMMYGLYDLIKNRFFREGSIIIAVHTGGLQGNAGFNLRYNNLLV